MKCILFLSLLVYFFGSLSSVSGSDKVRLKEVEVLTLRQGQWTTGRRSAPVQQVQCIGGTASGAFHPKVVQCYNRGSDGSDIQWECKTDMSNDYRFGGVTVTCEGYDYPEDDYVLKGSCGLEYTLDYTEQGMRNRGQQQHSGGGAPPYGFKQEYTGSNQQQSKKSGFDLGNIAVLLIVAFVIYVIYTSCIGQRQPEDSADSRRSGPGGYPGGGGPPPPGFRPDFQPPPPSYDDTCGASGQSRTNSSYQRGPAYDRPRTGGGFWTGMGLGGLAGYFFGNRQTGYGGYQQRQYGFRPPTQFEQDTGFHDQPSTSSWFGGGNTRSSSAYSGSSSSNSNSGTRTASGFGGTKRR